MTDQGTGTGPEPDGGSAPEAVPPPEEVTSAEPLAGSETAAANPPPRNTLAGRVWVAIGVAVIVLVLLIIFIAENSHDVTVSFLGAKGTISLGLAMLIAALAGVVITLLVGTTRIFQLRREVRRRHRAATRVS